MTRLFFKSFMMIVVLWQMQSIALAIELVSVSSNGAQSTERADNASLSADGRYVTFGSRAELAPGNTNIFHNIYLHDRQTGLTELISNPPNPNPNAFGSDNASISANGRYISFDSPNPDFNDNYQTFGTNIFVYDRQTGLTEFVSLNKFGMPFLADSKESSISANGRFVVFKNITNIFRHDRETGQTRRASNSYDNTKPNNTSRDPSISEDGRYVAFNSHSNTIIENDPGEYASNDIFVRDMDLGQNEIISGGDCELYFGVTTSTCVREAFRYSMSANGRFVVFELSGSATGSRLYDLSGLFLYDRQTGNTERVDVTADGVNGNSYPEKPSISANGRYIAFHSDSTNLIDGDTNGVSDIFVKDMITGQIKRINISDNGNQANADSYDSVISANGQVIAFTSDASNLVEGDTNSQADIFITDLGQPTDINYYADINPHHCPNKISTGLSNGQTVSIALAGQPGLSVWKIKANTLRLENQYSPVSFYRRDKILNHERQNPSDSNECFAAGVDGRKDLVLKFNKADVLDVMRTKLGRELRPNDTVKLSLTGELRDGRVIQAFDFLKISFIAN